MLGGPQIFPTLAQFPLPYFTMQIRISRLPLWLSGLSAAFLLCIVGRGLFYFNVLHRPGLEFLEGTGIPPVVIAGFIFIITLPAWRLRNEIMMELGDDALTWRTRDGSRITLAYRSMREVGIQSLRSIRRTYLELDIRCDDGQRYQIPLNNLGASYGDIFAELARRVPGMTQADATRQWLIRK